MEKKDLKPAGVFKYFEEICQVPRPSKKEEKMIAYLKAFGAKHNLETKVDEAGNVLIKKPATPGKENLQTVVLQSHIDMVCEKNNDVQHDFLTDPIETEIDGEWLKAKGTTLGADNGIGVATELAILADDSIEHGPLECLFTVDEETGLTGAFALQEGFMSGDDVMKMDECDTRRKVRPSQGVHLVVDSKFLGGRSALMIPKTKDGRVLFGVPWHGKVVLGTTDTPLNEASLEPRALEEEVDFILDQAGQYLDRKPTRADVLSIFAGLRPLAAPTHADSKKTKEISRNHKIYRSKSGLLTITGGKWTTYRAMAEDVINQAIVIGGLSPAECVTKNLRVHGYTKEQFDENDWNYVYGSDASKIQKMIEKEPSFAEKLYEGYTFTVAHVVWAAREEFAQNIEDVLARRVRMLFLDANQL